MLTRRSTRRDPGIGRIVELLKDNATRVLSQPHPVQATQRLEATT